MTDKAVVDGPVSAPKVSFAAQLDLPGVRDLLLNLVKAELTSRYKTPTFGVLWFLLNPALMSAVLIVVFQEFIRLSIERYQVFVLVALLPWTFFQLGLTNATTSFTRATAMIKRVKIPRALLPTASILANLVHYVLSLAILLIVLSFSGSPPQIRSLLLLPVVIIAQTICLFGIGLAAATLNVIYRDVEHMIQMALRIGFWATPIFYPFEYVPPRWQWLVLMNPMTAFIEIYRALLVKNAFPEPRMIVSGAVSTVALLIGGAAVFQRLNRHLDDYV